MPPSVSTILTPLSSIGLCDAVTMTPTAWRWVWGRGDESGGLQGRQRALNGKGGGSSGAPRGRGATHLPLLPGPERCKEPHPNDDAVQLGLVRPEPRRAVGQAGGDGGGGGGGGRRRGGEAGGGEGGGGEGGHTPRPRRELPSGTRIMHFSAVWRDPADRHNPRGSYAGAFWTNTIGRVGAPLLCPQAGGPMIVFAGG
jgi:hypothetical protein